MGMSNAVRPQPVAPSSRALRWHANSHPDGVPVGVSSPVPLSEPTKRKAGVLDYDYFDRDSFSSFDDRLVFNVPLLQTYANEAEP